MDPEKEKNPVGILYIAGMSALSALLGSLCVFGPILFAGVGTAGVGAALAGGTGALIPFGPLFWLAAFGGFGAAFYRMFRAPACYPRWSRWVLAGLAALIFVLGVFISAAEAADLKEVQLQVEGLKGRACVKLVRKGLTRAPGVKEVDIQKKFFASTGRVSVRFDPEMTGPKELIRVVESQGTPVTPYQAFVVESPGSGGR